MKQLILENLGPQATELSNLFQDMKSDNLEYLCIEGSRPLTDNVVQSLAIRAPTNLKVIGFYNCPNLKLQESTLINLKNDLSYHEILLIKVVGYVSGMTNLNHYFGLHVCLSMCTYGVLKSHFTFHHGRTHTVVCISISRIHHRSRCFIVTNTKIHI